MKVVSHLELFAGIGGFRKAIDLLCYDLKMKSNCIGFSEFDSYATETYKANYNTKDEVELGDIYDFTLNKKNIKKLENFDLLTAGFPCQSFSMMGKKLGLNDKRGNIFYSIIKILKVKNPQYFILENVRNLKNHDKGNTYKEIYRSLTEDVDYNISDVVLNTSDFGLPQVRRRIFIIGVCNKNRLSDKVISSEDIVKNFNTIKNSSLNYYKNVKDGILNQSVDEKYYLSEKIKPTILADGSKNYKSKSMINREIARTLTASMVKMHRANQDNYYSDDFFKDDYDDDLFQKKSLNDIAKKRIRKITPLEALKLQGFDESFFINAKNKNLSNHQLYKQSGNAVSVNTVYALLDYLIRKKFFLFK